jgi:hypothetical protein
MTKYFGVAASDLGTLVTSSIPVGSAVSLTTATAANVTSITLAPGDWDISGVIDFNPAATTSVTNITAGVSLTSATLAAQTGGSGLGTDPTMAWNQAASVPAGVMAMEVPAVRLSITATTTVYLVAKATFTVSTMTAYGTIRANRVAAPA